ncbi:MAG TPA: (2Fe-2S)-binding protein [Terriglobia bacterium]|nr:(2Fe-2S)-binding protein [Terriglobia bacterium]
MSETLVTLSVNGKQVAVPAGSTVSTAVALAGITAHRRSVTGEPRAPLCGMGICFECRVTINGSPHCRSCQVLIENGMQVQTDEFRASV